MWSLDNNHVKLKQNLHYKDFIAKNFNMYNEYDQHAHGFILLFA